MKFFKSVLLVTALSGFGCATENETDADVVLIDQAKMMDMEEMGNADTEATMVSISESIELEMTYPAS